MIAGTQNPIVGKDEFYQFTDARDIFNTANATFVWYIWKKQKSGKWINITGESPKMGQKVSYNFGQKVVGTEFKLQVYKATKKVLSQEFQAKLADEIVVVPSSSHVPKITKVVLFNRGAKDPNKASYRDTLVARAYCVAMFNQEVEFHLWEDDAPGGGHHSTINKNNQLPQAFKARVNEKGIAEVNISLLSNAAVLKAIANKYMMHGDKNEGANHEYYVTASYAGKIQKASQVNVDVANPDYKIKPKENSPKFPATSVSKTKTQADPKGEITNAYFVNDKNEKLSRVAVGHHVKVLIKSKNLVGKYIQYVVWEQDIGWPDEIFRSGKIKIPGDLCVTGGFPITEKLFKKGIDSPFSDSDSKKQNYFLEIIVLDSTAESKKFGLDDKAGQPMEVVRSAAKVENIKEEKKSTSCICQEQYKDLVWGGKVSCEFRKKVVQICAELWGEGRKMEMANGLMAVMDVETAGSFKAHQIMGKSLKDVNSLTKDDFWLTKKDKEGKVIEKTSRAVGLIQFTQAALESIEQFKSGSGFDKLHEVKLRFAKMGEINQLSYVKDYFKSNKNKIKTPEDIYLHVFAPKGVGKTDDYILYTKGTEEYRQNASVDTGSRGVYTNDGFIQRSEILERFHDSLKEGRKNLASKYICSDLQPVAEEKPSAMPKNGMLSVHLSLAQAIKSDTAKKHGLDNTPSATEKENLKQLGTNIYDKIYNKFDGNVKLTSVFRNSEVNAKVGGSSTSQHRYGQALDIKGTNGITNKQIFKYVKDNLDYHQIIWEFGSATEPSWVHIGYKSSGNKKINTRAVKVNGKTTYKTFDLTI